MPRTKPSTKPGRSRRTHRTGAAHRGTAGDFVVLFGTAAGTCTLDGALAAERRWRTPAAWRARVRGSAIVEWRVYADNAGGLHIVHEDGGARGPAVEIASPVVA